MNSLKSHPVIAISTHPRILLHGRYPVEIPPASSHASVVMPHPPPNTLAHLPPFSSHSICSNVGEMTKLTTKIITRIAITIKTTFELLRGTSAATKSLLIYPYFTLEGESH